MRGYAGSSLGLTFGSHRTHPAAFFRTSAACLCAFLAMLHLMLAAFIPASITNFRTSLADGAGKRTAASHIAGCKAANLGAVDVQCDTASHRLRILLL